KDYTDIQGRIRMLRPVMEKMEKKYLFTNLNVSLSKIEQAGRMAENDAYPLYVNDVTIRFETISDEYIFNFIEDLRQQLPGYIKLLSLSMNRNKNISQEMLQT